jgi:hypothetical protein
MVFVVQVKGTMDLEGREWMKGVSQVFTIEDKKHYLPSCIFVVDVRINKAVYSWVAEPVVEENKAVLKLRNIADYHDLDRAQIDAIVEQVKAWYSVLSREHAAS